MAFSGGDLHIIETFADQLGLKARAAKDGSYSFVFDEASTLSFTPARPEGVVVSLSWRPPRLDAAMARATLRAGGYDARTGQLTHASVSSGDDLILSLRLSENEISIPSVDQCIQSLFAKRTGIMDRA